MAYTYHQPVGGDSQKVGCLYKPISGIYGHPNTHEYLTGFRNKPRQKQTHEVLQVVFWQLARLLMELSFTSVCICGAFGKSGHA